MSFDRSADNYLKSSDHKTGSDLDYFAEKFGGMTFKRSLDVACAAGHFANAVNAEAKFVTDLSHNMLKKAKEAFGLNNSALAKAEFLPFLDDSFDFVGCRIAMHHFRNPCMFFAETFRILSDGGYFVLIDSVVDEDDEHLNHIEFLRDPSHFKSHSIENIIGIAEAEGFSPAETAVFSKRHDFREWVTRLSPTEAVCTEVENLFLSLPEDYKERYALEISDGRLVSYTDRKALFIFRK